jgi:hypothetical protein
MGSLKIGAHLKSPKHQIGASIEKQDILSTLEVPTQIGTGLESKNYLGTIF